MTDLERLARVLCAEDRIDPEGAVLVGMKTMRAWEARLPKARAVLTALREPSDAMLGSGGVAMTKAWTDPWDELDLDGIEFLALPDAPDGQLWEAYKHVSPLTYATWQAMIDAALSDA